MHSFYSDDWVKVVFHSMENDSRSICLVLHRKVSQSTNTLVFSRCTMQLKCLYQFPGDTTQLIIQGDIISHMSLVFVLCHGYQWSSIEKCPFVYLTVSGYYKSNYGKRIYQSAAFFKLHKVLCLKYLFVKFLKTCLTSLLLDK